MMAIGQTVFYVPILMLCSRPISKFFRLFNTPESPDKTVGKAYLGAHPCLVPGIATLKAPLHVILYWLLLIQKMTTHFSKFVIFVGCKCHLPRMKSQNMLRWFTATLSGIKFGKSISFCKQTLPVAKIQHLFVESCKKATKHPILGAPGSAHSDTAEQNHPGSKPNSF
jgi:hypothetical protein